MALRSSILQRGRLMGPPRDKVTINQRVYAHKSLTLTNRLFKLSLGQKDVGGED